MNDSLFSSSFKFYEFHFHNYQHNDVSGGASVHYIAWMKRGRAELIHDTGKLAVGEGDLFYIPKGFRYHSYWYGDQAGDVLFDSLGFGYFPNPRELHYPLQKIDCPPEALALLRQISAEKAVDCAGVGLFYNFFGQLLPHMKTEQYSQRSELIERALEFMYTHQEYKAADIAAFCGISESGLYAAFKKELDQTPVEVRHRLMAEQAVELLTTTNLPIEEISDRLRFSSPSYFRKVMRQQTGQSPREIRKSRSF